MVTVIHSLRVEVSLHSGSLLETCGSGFVINFLGANWAMVQQALTESSEWPQHPSTVATVFVQGMIK